uniref:Neur_chan_LBD domain-containing protein n=1 Tax=Macrostomum lignano TaxID=282301 RepID=A0A1I8IIL2_9PLAT
MNRTNYRSSVRPVTNYSQPVLLYMNLSLTQILDVDEKNQIVTLNMWVSQQWHDPNFVWNPAHYGNITELHIPSEDIWTPDLVLLQYAGGDWDLGSSANKVNVLSDGTILWRPPIIFKSQCEINVEFFPFDTQNCTLKLGTWTHNGYLIDLRHVAQKEEADRNGWRNFDNCKAYIDYAIDLSQFVDNVEWDILEVAAKRNIEKYKCCPEPYLDLTFSLNIRRKTLFYGVNLICPCLAISFLTILVFYLPGESGEKMSLSINILLSLTVFFLLIFDICPPTSLVVPLILKYLLFTMILVTLSVMATVIVLNVHWRSPDTYVMAPWVRQVFMRTLPKLLLMKKPETERRKEEVIPNIGGTDTEALCAFLADEFDDGEVMRERLRSRRTAMTSSGIINEIELALEGVRNIATHMKKEDERNTIRDDWKYVAVVLDRLFMWLFSCAAII